MRRKVNSNCWLQDCFVTQLLINLFISKIINNQFCCPFWMTINQYIRHCSVHGNDITWVPWRLKSPTCRRCVNVVHINNKVYIKLPGPLDFHEGNIPVTYRFLDSVIRSALPLHGTFTWHPFTIPACPRDTYKSLSGTCLGCPAYSHTVDTGNQIEGCVCDTGFERLGEPGTQCTGKNEYPWFIF